MTVTTKNTTDKITDTQVLTDEPPKTMDDHQSTQKLQEHMMIQSSGDL